MLCQISRHTLSQTHLSLNFLQGLECHIFCIQIKDQIEASSSSDLLYQIEASSSSRPKIVHVDNLRPYEPEIMPIDWRHFLSTNKTNSDDEFDKNECEGCDGDCDNKWVTIFRSKFKGNIQVW